jgi:hypothetical protein
MPRIPASSGKGNGEIPELLASTKKIAGRLGFSLTKANFSSNFLFLASN